MNESKSLADWAGGYCSQVLILLGNLGITDISAGELIRNYWPFLLIILDYDPAEKRVGYLLGGILLILGFLLRVTYWDFRSLTFLCYGKHSGQ